MMRHLFLDGVTAYPLYLCATNEVRKLSSLSPFCLEEFEGERERAGQWQGRWRNLYYSNFWSKISVWMHYHTSQTHYFAASSLPLYPSLIIHPFWSINKPSTTLQFSSLHPIACYYPLHLSLDYVLGLKVVRPLFVAGVTGLATLSLCDEWGK